MLANIEDSSCWVISIDINPNPSDGVFSIEVFAEDVRTLEMSVINVVGTVILTTDPEEFTGVYVKEIDLTGNNNGLYFLRVLVNDEEFNRKLVLIE